MHDIARAAADAAHVPPFDEVLARGRRHRARRQAVLVGATAVAVASVVGVTQVVGSGDGRAPQPAPSITSEVPSPSAATTLPYWVDGSLHVGDTVVETDLASSVYAAGTTVASDVETEGPSEISLVDGAGLVPVFASDELALPTLSRDGELVVVMELPFPTEDSQRLVAWDVASRTEVAAIDIPVADASRPFLVVGVDQDHRVFLTDRVTALMWVPGEEPVPLTGVDPSDLGAVPWPGGLSIRRSDGDGGISSARGDAFGTVDDSGAFREVGTLSTTRFGTWSPDGAVFVAYGSTPTSAGALRGTLGLEHADGREPDTLELPDPGAWMPLAWESETRLVLAVMGDQPDPDVPAPTVGLTRCDVVALTCTRIDDVPTGAVRWAADAGQ